MVCRCRDIEMCVSDIRILESELAQELNAAQRNNGLGTSAIQALGQNLTSAAFVDNMARIETRLTAIMKQRDVYFSNLQSRRSSELSKVLSKRSSYENEDRRYHEMQGK